MLKLLTPLALCAALCTISGCANIDVYDETLIHESGEPGYITVQHCLISFNGANPQISSSRTQEEAKALAYDLFEKAKAGEDFDRIVKKYTDDSPPGIYRMANFGLKADMESIVPSKKIFARSGMVPAFGDVGFPLNVGEFGISEYSDKSPYGWHIIKRLK